MPSKFLGEVLTILIIIQAAMSEEITQNDNSLDCSEIIHRLPKDLDLLEKAMDIYTPFNYPAWVPIMDFGINFFNNDTQRYPFQPPAIELYLAIVITDYTNPVEDRAIQLLDAIEFVIASFSVNKNIEKMLETALQVPLMVVDRLFKEFEKLHGLESAKMAQKTIRSLFLTEKYLAADEETKKKMIMETSFCFFESMGPENGLDHVVKLINTTL